MKGFILCITALLIWLLTAPVALLWQLVDCIRYKQWNQLGRWFMAIAAGIDLMGNITHKSMFNGLFLKRAPYEYFGLRWEFITVVLGRNWCMNGLALLGESMVGFLNALDPDHCWKWLPDKLYFQQPAPVAWYKTLLAMLILNGMLYGFLLWVLGFNFANATLFFLNLLFLYRLTRPMVKDSIKKLRAYFKLPVKE